MDTQNGTLRPQVRSELASLASKLSKSGEHSVSDVWRAVQEEASKLTIKDRIEASLHSAVSLKLNVDILDHHCTTTRHGYSFYSASIVLRHQDSSDALRLVFRYERQAIRGDANDDSRRDPTVSYTIDIMDGRLDTPNLAAKLLWVQVWAANVACPSPETRLIEMLHEGSGDGGDANDGALPEEESGQDDLEASEPRRKKPRIVGDGTDDSNSNDDASSDRSEEMDHYLAGVDVELLERLRETLALSSMNDADACQFLLRFPFSESEWDLEGMLFDALFDHDDEE